MFNNWQHFKTLATENEYRAYTVPVNPPEPFDKLYARSAAIFYRTAHWAKHFGGGIADHSDYLNIEGLIDYEEYIRQRPDDTENSVVLHYCWLMDCYHRLNSHRQVKTLAMFHYGLPIPVSLQGIYFQMQGYGPKPSHFIISEKVPSDQARKLPDSWFIIEAYGGNNMNIASSWWLLERIFIEIQRKQNPHLPLGKEFIHENLQYVCIGDLYSTAPAGQTFCRNVGTKELKLFSINEVHNQRPANTELYGERTNTPYS